LENKDLGWERISPLSKIIGSFREANISEGLLNIVTTNLKKSGGTGESAYEVIRKHAVDNKKELWTN
jgi:hypothetical protein